MKPGEAREGMRVMKLREYDRKPMVWARGTIKKVEIFQGQETALVFMHDSQINEYCLTVRLRKDS
jgi:hypothetical protein